MEQNFRYIRLADEFESKIKAGDFEIGEKLPSIRRLHHRSGLSITTVYQALIELEKRNLVETRPKSGFYVKTPIQQVLNLPDPERHKVRPHKVSINELFTAIVETMGDKSMVHFGGAAPAPALLPYKSITRAIRSVINTEIESVLTYEPPQGISELRREIAKQMFGTAANIEADQIIITNGCMEAIALCLKSVADPGDKIAVESPCFQGFLQIMEDLNLVALELPTHPVSGIDLDALEDALKTQKIKACILGPNVNNPLGYVMPEDHKRRLVKMMNTKNIPIIEDGIYNDLYFGQELPPTLKSFDEKDLILYCSSFSKTLAPGLRVGWAAPGRFYKKVKRFKVNGSITCSGLNQRIVAECLKKGLYNRHIRKMKNELKVQISKMTKALADYFPPDTKISSPQGGLLLWVQLHPSVDGFEVYRKALKKKIAIMPGFLCSSSGRYKSCIRLNCGFPWNERIESSIAALGRTIKAMIKI